MESYVPPSFSDLIPVLMRARRPTRMKEEPKIQIIHKMGGKDNRKLHQSLMHRIWLMVGALSINPDLQNLREGRGWENKRN